MAFQMDKSFNGLTVPKAYIRVERVELRAKTDMYVVVSINVDSQSAAPLYYQGYSVVYDLNNPDNALKQSYEKLKLLPDFSAAVDVLEAGQTI